jgi:hypothetical protein
MKNNDATKSHDNNNKNLKHLRIKSQKHIIIMVNFPEQGTVAWAIQVHGICMAISWALLIPLGILMARHKWMFYDKEFLGVRVWYHLHRLIQLAGAGLFVYAWVLMMTSAHHGHVHNQVGFAHNIIGYLVMGLVGVQLISVLIRPPPEHSKRWVWNAIHNNSGRLTTLLAWADLGIGIYFMRNSPAFVSWLVPISVSIFTVLAFDLVLSIVKCKRIDKKQDPVVA